MGYSKDNKLRKIISIDNFQTCLIDGLSLEEVCKKYTRRDLNKKVTYRLDKFNYHLEKAHNTNIVDYYEEYIGKWPTCEASGEKLNYQCTAKGLRFSLYKGGVKGVKLKEISPDFEKFCNKMSKDRKGEGNPMYGSTCWRKGLTKDTDERIREGGEKYKKYLENMTEEQVKQKLEWCSLGGKASTGNTGNKHSEESIQKMREATARRIAERKVGCKKRTSIEEKIFEFLESLGLKFKKGILEEQFQVKYFTVDFAFPCYKLAIEADGDFFHSNPKLYPNGPISAVQRRNWGRDKAKNQYLEKKGWKVLRYWEMDINSGKYKKELTKELKDIGII